MRTRQKQRIIIGTLCAVIIGLAVGYAVLSQTLTINGTGGIASDFNILFTDIGEGTMNGATNVNKQITDSATATFTIDLSKPGASGEYLITVENRGTLDAYVESINGLDEANQTEPTDITFSIEDVKVNDKLPASESKIFKVKVDWSSTSTSIPSTNKDLTLSINFAQDTGNVPTTGGNAGDYLIDNVVSEDITSSPTEGLFAIDDQGELTTADSPRKYRYIGADPDNYIEFNNELWRIIGIFDGQLKIIRNESLGGKAWDDADEQNPYGESDWGTSPLQTYLNNDYYGSINSEDQIKIDSIYAWKLGQPTTDDDVIAQMFYEAERGTDVIEGNSTEWTGSIGLIYASDYGFATSGGSTTNRSSCLSIPLFNWIDVEDCSTNNWLYVDYHWTLTSYHKNVFAVFYDGCVLPQGASFIHNTHPVVYLLSNVEIVSGIGTPDEPFVLS
mgnify:CR=1 FL=1